MSRKVFVYRDNKISEPLELPSGKVVHAEFQYDEYSVWVEHEFYDGTNEVVSEKPLILEVFGTGHSIPDGPKHISTHKTGPFVWHLYQV